MDPSTITDSDVEAAADLIKTEIRMKQTGDASPGEFPAGKPKHSLFKHDMHDAMFLGMQKMWMEQNVRYYIREHVGALMFESHVHGIKEIFAAKRRATKVFWIIVCGLCISMAFHEIASIIYLYMRGDSATKIQFVSEGSLEYPTPLFCPSHWIDKQRLKKIGMDDAAMEQAVGYIPNPGAYSTHLWSFGFANKVKKAKETLNASLVKHFDSFGELLLNVSLAPQDHEFACPHAHQLVCQFCNRSQIERVLTVRGVCYRFRLNRADLLTTDLPFIVNIVSPRNMPAFMSYIKGSAYVSLVAANEVLGLSTADEIFVPPNVPVVVKLGSYKVKRLSRYNPCYGKDHMENVISQSNCEYGCVDSIRNEACKGCSVARIYSATSLAEMCSFGTDEDHCKLNGTTNSSVMAALALCTQQCKPPCFHTVYYVNSMLYLTTARKENQFGSMDLADFLKVTFQYSSFSYGIYEDVETLNLHTLISTIGGQTGLWCGASVISILQLFSFLFCPCIHFMDRKKSELKLVQSMRRSFRRQKSSLTKENS